MMTAVQMEQERRNCPKCFPSGDSKKDLFRSLCLPHWEELQNTPIELNFGEFETLSYPIPEIPGRFVTSTRSMI